MQLPQTIEVKGIRVLTTSQIARAYETKEIQIHQNFKNNRGRFVDGKHYISLSGDDLKAFKNHLEKIEVVKSRTSHLYLWTEKGALLHAKSLNTDKAWEVYDYLVDFYFRAKEERKVPVTLEPKAVPVENVEQTDRRSCYFYKPDNPIKALEILLQVAKDSGIPVYSYPLKTFDSVLHNNAIGIRTEVTVEKACYELAYELSHAFIHHNGGDLVKSPLAKEYNQRAERAANMIIKILNVKTGKA